MGQLAQRPKYHPEFTTLARLVAAGPDIAG